jgi:hypothetical protein
MFPGMHRKAMMDKLIQFVGTERAIKQYIQVFESSF